MHGDTSTGRIVAAHLQVLLHAHSYVRMARVGRCSPGAACRAILVGLPC